MWLRGAGDKSTISDFILPGYSVLHKAWQSGKCGSGVVFRQQLKVRLCKKRSLLPSITLKCVLLAQGKQTIRLLASITLLCPPRTKFQWMISLPSLEDTCLIVPFWLRMCWLLVIPTSTWTNHVILTPNISLSCTVQQVGLHQLVTESTHIKGHTLDIVLTRSSRIVWSVSVKDLHIPDHFFIHKIILRLIFWVLIKSQNIKGIDPVTSRTSMPPKQEDLSQTVPPTHKRKRRKYKMTLAVDAKIDRRARQNVTKAINAAKAEYFQKKMNEAAFNSKMFSILYTLLNRQSRSDALPDMDSKKIADLFSEYFHKRSPQSDKASLMIPLILYLLPVSLPPACFHAFEPPSNDQIRKLILSANPITLAVNLAPTKLSFLMFSRLSWKHH